MVFMLEFMFLMFFIMLISFVVVMRIIMIVGIRIPNLVLIFYLGLHPRYKSLLVFVYVYFVLFWNFVFISFFLLVDLIFWVNYFHEWLYLTGLVKRSAG